MSPRRAIEGGFQRRRIGGYFDTKEEAAKAYSEECRKMLLEEMAEADAEDAEDGRKEEAGGSGPASASSNGGASVSANGGTGVGAAVFNAVAESDEEADPMEDNEGAEGVMGDFEVEAILGERRVRVGRNFQEQYHVKWKGYGDTTWEPLKHVKDCIAFQQYLARRAAARRTARRAKAATSATHMRARRRRVQWRAGCRAAAEQQCPCRERPVPGVQREARRAHVRKRPQREARPRGDAGRWEWSRRLEAATRACAEACGKRQWEAERRGWGPPPAV